MKWQSIVKHITNSIEKEFAKSDGRKGMVFNKVTYNSEHDQH